MKLLFSFGLSLSALCPGFAADPFAENVRTTEPLTAEEQLKTFQAPPGFEVQLVASEPDLQKPMNMAFDSKGRLWVSMSREYPYPAPLDQPSRDMIRVFEDFDENGRARKSTTFAEGLNIPIGILPYGNGVIAWSIPNIWYFQDTDGDGQADKKEVLFGPLGWERDTHGNQASFRRGFDGWIYATHGFNNNSHFRARDGSELSLNSGNTYRFRPDGSRIESHTWGQVNPFGLCFDPAGNIYSADCHSAPIYELLRGGFYPSFGKPHDGLGFAPTLMEHTHGSTAICGILHYSDDRWPEEFQNNILVGNVMTSRINRDTLLPRGSSKTAREEADFLTTSDPWFRPVDIQLGPDGALYVADFYNRIIGHYEVPLAHPGRDRERARIWRVVYKGQPSHGLPDLSKKSAEQLIAEFSHPNQTRRLLALNELVDRIGEEALPALKKALASGRPHENTVVHALWALQRLGAETAPSVASLLSDSSALVRTHVARLLSEEKSIPNRSQHIIRLLGDKDVGVRRAAADAAAQHPSADLVQPLLTALKQVEPSDDHLRHTLRMALRNQFQGDGGNLLRQMKFSPDEQREIASICLGLPSPHAAAFLVQRLEHKDAQINAADGIRHAVRYIDEQSLPKLTALIQSNFKSDVDQQLAFFKALQEGAAQRGMALPGEAKNWGAALAEQLLDSASQDQSWTNHPDPNGTPSANPWFLQKRSSADGQEAWFICSLPPGGEHLTGILRSKTFRVPPALSFYLAGHDGVPGQPAQGNNLVRLISVEDGTVLAHALPPRNDLAQKIEWDLSRVEGREAYLELVDRDTGSGYAWIAVGRLEPAVVPLPATSPNQTAARIVAAADIARTLKLDVLAPRMGELLLNDSTEPGAQGALAGALVSFAPNETRLALAPLAGDHTLSPVLRRQIRQALAEKTGATPVLIAAMQSTPARIQTKLAQSLAASATGAERLLSLVEKKQASAHVLMDPSVRDKMAALKTKSLNDRLDKATAHLEPPSESIRKLIEAKRTSYNPRAAEAAKGEPIFVQSCAACHQLEGKGTLVGPQLDGIGNRGLERLLEDILDPNRNVDINFRSQILVLEDGDVVSGLPRREEGELLVLADSAGQEVSVPKAAVQSRRESETSLMPSNFGDILSEKDLNNLVAFLLSKNAAESGSSK